MLRRSGMFVRAIALGGCVCALAACGGSDDSTGPTSQTLTAAQAQLVASSLFSEMSKAMSTATLTTGGSSSSPSQTFTVNSTCTNGGTITGQYVYNSSLNSAGTGTVSGSMTTTAHGCKVNTGTQIIATDGTLNYSYSVSYTAFAPSSNYVWKGTGNFSWDGGSCTMDYTVNVSTTGHGSISGTICGQSINQTV